MAFRDQPASHDEVAQLKRELAALRSEVDALKRQPFVLAGYRAHLNQSNGQLVLVHPNGHATLIGAPS